MLSVCALSLLCLHDLQTSCLCESFRKISEQPCSADDSSAVQPPPLTESAEDVGNLSFAHNLPQNSPPRQGGSSSGVGGSRGGGGRAPSSVPSSPRPRTVSDWPAAPPGSPPPNMTSMDAILQRSGADVRGVGVCVSACISRLTSMDELVQ